MKSFEELYLTSIQANSVHKNGFTNHLPMALLALQEFGAEESQLNRFAENYQSKLINYEMRTDSRIDSKNWREHLGKEDYVDDFYLFFQAECQKSEPKQVLQKYLHTLAYSPLSSAFHAIIRMGYTIEYQRWEDIPFSLANWASTFLEIPACLPQQSSFHPEKYDFDFLQNFLAQYKITGSGITNRAKIAMTTARYQSIYQQFGKTDGLEVAKRFALQSFAETLDFTALHLITGSYATGLICDFLGDSEASTACEQRLLPSVVATYLSMIRAQKHTIDFKQNITPEEVRDTAKISLNDHVVKIADVAIKEFQRTNELLYLQAAYAYASEE